jgi:acetolactate synthase-1/2/3 large subunit
MKQASVESTADAYLELLAARGIDYLFGNAGTDFGPIVDAYAKRFALEQPVPTPVTVPHETTAVAMAHGYTMITGKAQVVMVHTIAGTANATAGIITASRANVPMLFSAGRTPLTENGYKGSRDGGIHWTQESFDQGAMVREWVKWDYELRHGADLEGVVDRALAITNTEPQAPVYLTLPREVLAEEISSFEYSERPRMIAAETCAAPDQIREAARALVRAKNPIVLTNALGRDPAAVDVFVRFAESLNLPVFGNGSFMNFPSNHRLFQSGPANAHFANADLVLVVESNVPWMPRTGPEPREDAMVIGLGTDPLFANIPVRGFRVDLGLGGAPRLTLAALTDAIKAENPDAAMVAERGRRWEEEHDKGRKALRDRAEATKSSRPLEKAWVSYCLDQVRDDDTIITNEIGLEANQFDLRKPGTYFANAGAGVLGWAVGATVGAKLAARDKTVVCCVGDGSYIFGAPEAAHWVSRKMDLPVLWLVWNNSQWGAVASATRGVYPDGWEQRTKAGTFSDLTPSLDFEFICQSAGGYGERVEDPAEVPAALQRALHAVKVEKRQALLNLVAGQR